MLSYGRKTPVVASTCLQDATIECSLQLIAKFRRSTVRFKWDLRRSDLRKVEPLARIVSKMSLLYGNVFQFVTHGNLVPEASSGPKQATLCCA